MQSTSIRSAKDCGRLTIPLQCSEQASPLINYGKSHTLTRLRHLVLPIKPAWEHGTAASAPALSLKGEQEVSSWGQYLHLPHPANQIEVHEWKCLPDSLNSLGSVCLVVLGSNSLNISSLFILYAAIILGGTPAPKIFCLQVKGDFCQVAKQTVPLNYSCSNKISEVEVSLTKCLSFLSY